MTIFSTSTSAFFERSRSGMSALRLQAESLQQQLGSGERLRNERPRRLRSAGPDTPRTNSELALIGHGAAPQCAKDRAETGC